MWQFVRPDASADILAHTLNVAVNSAQPFLVLGILTTALAVGASEQALAVVN